MNKLIVTFKIILIGAISLQSCSEDDSLTKPIVETVNATMLENGGVRLTGKIKNMRESSNYGLLLSTYEGGTDFINGGNDLYRVQGIMNGDFSVEIRNGLVEGQTYYFNVFLQYENINPYLEYEGDFLFGKEMSFISNGSAAPIIQSVTPQIAHVGDTIRIVGQHFSENFELFFDDKSSELLVQTDTLIETTVPFDYFRNTPYSSIKILKSTNEFTIFDEFSMFTPVISSVEPYYAHEQDTITIRGDHFNLSTQENRLSMLTNFDYSNLQIIESSRTEIKFVAGRFYELYPQMRLQSQFQTLDFNDRFEVKMPEIYGVSADCVEYDETLTIIGNDFPSYSGDVLVMIGGVVFNVQNTSKEALVLNVNDGFYSDFILEDVIIEYLDQTITHETQICINEPWIKLSFDNPFHPLHNYGNETYGILPPYYNEPAKLVIFNQLNNRFDDVPGVGLPEEIRFGTHRVWHQNNIYQYSRGFQGENKLYRYNFLTGTLDEMADFPGIGRSEALMAKVGNFIYLGLGRTSSYNPLGDIWRYSIDSNSWELVLTLENLNIPSDAINEPLVLAFENRLFFGGKNANNPSNQFWEIDLNSFSLIPKANLPINSGHGLKTTTIGNKGYFESFYLYEYDAINDQWTTYEEIDDIGYSYSSSINSIFTHNNTIYRSITTSAPYYNLLSKLNMSYLND